ncbi:DUF3999 family protein [Enterobacter kobei]|uniref:Membrane protein n=2 Tax=Enterobacter kobei TaxID=208224 RepID=A0AA86IZK2_9ENTR|nr:DUF3999 family protein [Enterobacter kobei]OLR19986.1 hypothetical protein BH713_04680 [Enterobacter kobei]BCU56767.1 membrane protein [Enterobacter kobei]SIQ58966.1 Protein of unknown function [Enterobacter kobei]
MTIIRRILFCALLGAALPGWSQDATPETPKDYAWGAALETTTASPLYQVTLPERIYTDSVAPDLRDVRVFNQQGHAVPFTLIPAVQKQTPPRTLPLRLFALEPVPENNAASETLWLRSQDGIEIRLDGEGKKTAGKSYLLTLPETQKDEFPLSQLKLTWNAVPANWQGRTDVYVSSDLKNWTLYGRDMPLMDLTSGSDRLLLDTLDFSATVYPTEMRYVLVVFNDAARAPMLTGATAVEQIYSDTAVNIRLNAVAKTVSSSVQEFSWQRPQPLVSVMIEAREGRVLPLAIEYRSAAKAAWQPLAKSVIYQLNGKSSEPLTTGGLVQAIRVTAVNGQLEDGIARVTGERASQTLIFNAQGKGPFLLAWGNGAAQPQAMEVDMLVPAALRQENAQIPEALVQDRIVLGGDARLTAVDPAQQQSQWKKMLVWAALVLGVLVLIGVGLGIWREVRQKSV